MLQKIYRRWKIEHFPSCDFNLHCVRLFSTQEKCEADEWILIHANRNVLFIRYFYGLMLSTTSRFVYPHFYWPTAMINEFSTELNIRFFVFCSWKLSISASVDVAEVLEQPEPGAAHAVQRAWPVEIVATGNHGRGYFQRFEGRPFAFAGGQEVRHPLPNVCSVRKPSSQHARPVNGRRNWPKTQRKRSTPENPLGSMAWRAHQGRHQERRLSRREDHQGGSNDLRTAVGKFHISTHSQFSLIK